MRDLALKHDSRVEETVVLEGGYLTLEVRSTGVSTVPLMLGDVGYVLQGLSSVLVDKERFFETFFYVINDIGVRFADGVVTAGQPYAPS